MEKAHLPTGEEMTILTVDELEKIAGGLSVEVETLAYPGHLDEQDLVLTDAFFKVLKNKKRSPHFKMIAQFVNEDALTLAGETSKVEGGQS